MAKFTKDGEWNISTSSALYPACYAAADGSLQCRDTWYSRISSMRTNVNEARERTKAGFLAALDSGEEVGLGRLGICLPPVTKITSYQKFEYEVIKYVRYDHDIATRLQTTLLPQGDLE